MQSENKEKMGILDFFKKKRSNDANDNIDETAIDEKLQKSIVEFVLESVEDKDNRVRIEDAICLAATIVAERCIDAAGDFGLRKHNFPPGSRVFSDNVNEILAGNTADKEIIDLPDQSIFGMLRNNLKDTYALPEFPNISSIIKFYAKNIGKEIDWGTIPLSIPENHYPFLLPLRIGYESRSIVDHLFQTIQADKMRIVRICTAALSELLKMVHDSIDPKIALTLTFELVNGMSKTAPMTDEAMKSVTGEMGDEKN